MQTVCTSHACGEASGSERLENCCRYCRQRSNMARFQRLLLASVTVFLICVPAHAALLASANVMAPLDLEGGPKSAWDDFANQLRIAKSMGVDAVSVDIWWGKVEKLDNQFDWSYYDRLITAIENAVKGGMKVSHCGGRKGYRICAL